MPTGSLESCTTQAQWDSVLAACHFGRNGAVSVQGAEGHSARKTLGAATASQR